MAREPRDMGDWIPPENDDNPAYEPVVPGGGEPISGGVYPTVPSSIDAAGGLKATAVIGGWFMTLAFEELPVVDVDVGTPLWTAVWREETGAYFKVDFTELTATIAGYGTTIAAAFAAQDIEIAAATSAANAATAAVASKINEAPIDGNVWGRKDGAWFNINSLPVAWASITGKPSFGALALLNTVGPTQIDALAVTTAKIALGAVDNAQIQGLAVTGGKIADDAVIFSKMQNINTATFIGRVTSGTGDPEMLTVAQVKTALSISAVDDAAFALKAPLASPALTGTPTAPTPAAADNDTSIATTAFVQGEIAAKAPLASPTLTGDPKAPTATTGDADTSIATTAFVENTLQDRGGNQGGARFEYVSTTQCRLVPIDGGVLTINGVPRKFTAITIANTAFTNLTLMYVYAYWTGSAVALEASTTVPVTGSSGIEVKTGDVTRTLVGAAYRWSDGFFYDGTNTRWVASWYNRRPKRLTNSTSGGAVTTSAAAISAVSYSIIWRDSSVALNLSCSFVNGVTAATASVQVYINGAAVGIGSGQYLSPSTWNSLSASYVHEPLATGMFTFGIGGSTNVGSATCYGEVNGQAWL